MLDAGREVLWVTGRVQAHLRERQRALFRLGRCRAGEDLVETRVQELLALVPQWSGVSRRNIGPDVGQLLGRSGWAAVG